MKNVNWGTVVFYITMAILAIFYCIRISRLG